MKRNKWKFKNKASFPLNFNDAYNTKDYNMQNTQ